MIKDKKLITIVGCGPGDKRFITQIGLLRIKEAEVIIGSKRLLDMFNELSVEHIEIGRDYNALANNILNMKESKIAILVSGDPGFFSLAKILVKKIGMTNCEVMPGISSVQLAFARIGENWNDAKFMSLHGRDEELDNFVEVVKHNDKVAVLTDEKNNPANIAKVLDKNKLTDIKAYVFENLSLENERIHHFDIKEMCDVNITGMNIVILLKGG